MIFFESNLPKPKYRSIIYAKIAPIFHTFQSMPSKGLRKKVARV